METEVIRYAYIYIEHSTMGRPYLKHKDLPEEMRKNIGAAFKEAGGIDLITVEDGEGSPPERRIVSVWDSTGGYDRWAKDGRTKPYIEFRDKYNEKNFITSLRTGPYTHVLKKEHE